MAAGDAVLLLHGMGRTRASMVLLGRHLSQRGYRVQLFGYSARRDELDDITRTFLEFAGRHGGQRYHLVGHSLGNIIARNAFRFGYPPGLGRIVMLAPPNAPAKLATDLAANTLFKRVMGDSGQKLADPSFYQQLPVPPVEFGIIAGARGQRLTFDEPNDCIVTVASTKLDGMADWLELPVIHAMIMNARATREQCVHFIEHGRFAASV